MEHAVRLALIDAVRSQYRLDWDGIHGLPHLERVRENGLRIASATGARADVVELFAYLHDSCRHNNHCDPDHGPRGAALAQRLRGAVFPLDDAGLALLVEACVGHTGGTAPGEVTIATCWDADRLDLGRVGKRPRPELLCTEAACDPAVIAWAFARSLRR